MTPYERLPHEEGAYPPSKHQPPRRWHRRHLAGLALCGVAAITVLHFAILGAFPGSSYYARFSSSSTSKTSVQPLSDATPTISISRNGTYLRDAYPIRTLLDFWELAENEIAERGLDTCNDKLGRRLIEAYQRSRIDYVIPSGDTDGSKEGKSTLITCASVKYDSFSDWWPVPAAPCLSTHLRADDRKYLRYQSQVTEQGEKLFMEMTKETFIGSHLEVAEEDKCDEEMKRTLLVIPRQDQWNPFHVGEDMVTTVVSSLIAARARPELASEPIQLVFDDDFGLEGNHFVPMWDRMGAWPPRRLSLDPWRNACLNTVIHSVTAGVSLLSAEGVGEALTWAASHYYRHLFALKPRSAASSRPENSAINVLWLSRAKFDAWAMKENRWSLWRESRHISNEPQILTYLRKGLAGLCNGCFIDENDTPGFWGESSPERSIRFATMDPSVHSLETQVHMVGHASILVGLHGGAMGLSMFLPPGEAAVVELTTAETAGSKHFATMSAQLGLQYDAIYIDKNVDVEGVWRVVENRVRDLL